MTVPDRFGSTAPTSSNVRVGPAFIAGLCTLALWAVGFVPILGMFTFFLVPTAILLTLALLVAGLFGRSSGSRWLVGFGFIVLVVLAGIVSRSVDRHRARDLYAVQTTLISSLELEFGTPVQVNLSGAGVASAGDLRYSDITARTPGPVCEGRSELGCSRTVALKWASDVAWDQPHKAVGRLGLRAVASPAPIVFSTAVSEEEGHVLLVTSELHRDEKLIAQSIRRLPAEDPGPGVGVELWFWHVLENNLPALIFGPSTEPIPERLFLPFLSTAVVVLPERTPESTPAEILSDSVFEPPQVKTHKEVRDLVLTGCPVRDFGETGFGHTAHNLWDEPGKTVSSIPTHADESLCTGNAFYTFGLVANDTFMIERYDFDGTLRWRHAVRFSSPFEYSVTLPQSTFTDTEGRVSATLNLYEKQWGEVSGRREILDKVLLRRAISFAFATPHEPKTD